MKILLPFISCVLGILFIISLVFIDKGNAQQTETSYFLVFYTAQYNGGSIDGNCSINVNGIFFSAENIEKYIISANASEYKITSVLVKNIIRLTKDEYNMWNKKDKKQ